MKIKLALELATFDKARYQEMFDDWMLQTLAVMGAAYLQATAVNVIAGTTGDFRVWSGASAATFLHLADAIKFRVPITGGSSTGRNYGKRHSSGGIEIDKGVGKFYYTTDLAHLIWNEYHNANVDRDPGIFSQLKHPGPYNFQAQGLAAVQNALVDHKAGLPDPTLAIRIQRIKVS